MADQLRTLRKVIRHLTPGAPDSYAERPVRELRVHGLAIVEVDFDPRQPHGLSGAFQHEPGALCVVCDKSIPPGGIASGDAAV